MTERREINIKIGDKKFKEYINEIEKDWLTNNATELTYRPTLKKLIESLIEGLNAMNDPKKIECGAPDFLITLSNRRIGYIETKDINTNLTKEVKTEQIKRYISSLPISNFILTNYLEFRWYTGGELRAEAILGNIEPSGKIKIDLKGVKNVQQLLSDFLLYRVPSIVSAKELASKLARTAQMIRNLIIETIKTENENGSLHLQLKAFKETLITDLDEEQFADMYAQTIVYGLFAARTMCLNGKKFTRENAAYLIPKTNPFLRNLFNVIAGPNLNDEITWLIDDLSQLLADADMHQILQDFSKQTKKEDPVVHFYETFLTKYNPKIREMRGVYYTPEAVVSYITNSIDLILKKVFNKPNGIIHPDVLILDPAVGTGTFLFSVIKLIYENLENQRGVWNEYVEKHLLPRIFGFELLIAPYAVCHLKLGILLQELGYQFKSEQRIGVYLTNTLEEPLKKSHLLFGQFIAEESNFANEIKQNKPIMVILGNPPYSGISANKGTWIEKLIEDYKIVDGKSLKERKLWLADDYVKFIRFGQWKIETTGCGVLAFITNHSYLNNPTFRGMRQSLLNTFNEIYILNLHGNVREKETSPDGSKDENVFDIKQGVAISIFIKELNNESKAKIFYADLWGKKEKKYKILAENNIYTIKYKEIYPNSPYYFFVPQNAKYRKEYEKYWKITDIFNKKITGIVTARDEFVIDFEKISLENKIKEFINKSIDDITIKEKYKLSENYAWRVSEARRELERITNLEKYFTKILYRPFDIREIFFHPSVVWRTREKIMKHMMKENLGLVTCRQQSIKGFYHVLVADTIIESCYISNKTKEIGYIFPLYLYPEKDKPKKQYSVGAMMLFESNEKYNERKPNFNDEFLKYISKQLGTTPSPEEIFYYIYAILHSPTFRKRYEEFLKTDFPRIPITSDKNLFAKLYKEGKTLVLLHLLKSPAVEKFITKFPVTGSNVVSRVKYDEKNKKVFINEVQYFEGIPKEIYEFQIGGYQILEKWLQMRKGKKLSFDEVQHYQKIVVALKETILIMNKIDNIINNFPIK